MPYGKQGQSASVPKTRGIGATTLTLRETKLTIRDQFEAVARKSAVLGL